MTFLYQILLFGLPGALLAVAWRTWAVRGHLTSLLLALTGGAYVFVTMTAASFLFLGTGSGEILLALERGLSFAFPMGLVLYFGGRIMFKERDR